MDNIVVTGAAGFVGSHILEEFNRNGLERSNVIAACRTKSKLPDWYQGETLIGDLSDKEYIEILTERADIICHTAAWAEMNGSDEDSKKYFYAPTINVINSALKNGVKRFIFLSAITSNPIEQNLVHSSRKLNKIWPHYDSIIKIENHLKKVSRQGMDVIILRVGYFTGKNYALGLLPILLPRLKTYLVPWINKGKTTLPLIDGRDIGLAFKQTVTAQLQEKFYVVDIVGKEIPTVREVFSYLHKEYSYPLPFFSVSFKFAYGFARLMQLIHKIIPGDPLIVPAIVLLLEETNATNIRAEQVLNYKPKIHWKESIDIQINEMVRKQASNMKMNKN
ncbi:NAD-dependent epimerase/dehydratase family protein [Yeosuana marina]|uniref:NAD-dependent epimerase/dehydratase family protein n=1 Tax=Yeosuana marina TaxID=1565536 RepID=UPI001422A5C0|nr:NAD(P)-dependent oxidoreductase [Yeosuana marina]